QSRTYLRSLIRFVQFQTAAGSGAKRDRALSQLGRKITRTTETNAVGIETKQWSGVVFSYRCAFARTPGPSIRRSHYRKDRNGLDQFRMGHTASQRRPLPGVRPPE